MKKFTLSLSLGFISLLLAAQDELDIKGTASISESLKAHGITSTNGVDLTGNRGIRVFSSATSVLEFRASNPLVSFYDNASTFKAFIQSFDDDFYVSNRLSGRLYFRTLNLNRMMISADGLVGIGTSSPTSRLTVSGNENDGTSAVLELLSSSQKTIMDGNEIDCTSGPLHLNNNSLSDLMIRTTEDYGEVTISHKTGSGSANGVAIENVGGNNAYWNIYTTDGDGALELYYKGSYKGEFNATTGAYTSVSDRKLKENVRPLQSVLAKVKALKPSVYQFKEDEQHRDNLGFLAQDLAEQFPELVHQGYVGDSEEEIATVDYSGMGVVALAAIQELMAEGKSTSSEALMVENQQLKMQLTALEDRLAKLEEIVLAKAAE